MFFPIFNERITSVQIGDIWWQVSYKTKPFALMYCSAQQAGKSYCYANHSLCQNRILLLVLDDSLPTHRHRLGPCYFLSRKMTDEPSSSAADDFHRCACFALGRSEGNRRLSSRCVTFITKPFIISFPLPNGPKTYIEMEAEKRWSIETGDDRTGRTTMGGSVMERAFVN